MHEQGWLPRVVLPNLTHGQSVVHYFYATRQYVSHCAISFRQPLWEYAQPYQYLTSRASISACGLWWDFSDLNRGLSAYEAEALTTELKSRGGVYSVIASLALVRPPNALLN